MAQVRTWIYSVFCRILSWEVVLLLLIELLVIFLMIFGVLTLLSAIFQLYHCYQWTKPEYPERTTNHGKATSKLYHLRMRVECTLFAICKAGLNCWPSLLTLLFMKIHYSETCLNVTYFGPNFMFWIYFRTNFCVWNRKVCGQ